MVMPPASLKKKLIFSVIWGGLVVHHRGFDRQRLLRSARNDRAGCHCEEQRDEAISLSERPLTCQKFCGRLLDLDRWSVMVGMSPLIDCPSFNSTSFQFLFPMWLHRKV
jgi:hypothetical protein